LLGWATENGMLKKILSAKVVFGNASFNYLLTKTLW